MKSVRRIALLVLLVSIGFAQQSWAATPVAKTKSLAESNNGQRIQVTSGTTLQITLHSTYWTEGKVKNLVKIGEPQISPIMPSANATPGCQHAGMGCGTIIWKFKAVKKGSALFTATRISCGEALKCTADQTTYSLNIVIK